VYGKPIVTPSLRAAQKRELARDAAFMGEVRRKEKLAAAAKRDKTQMRALAFLEQQEADFKSGGQGDMNPHRKKKS
jgi:nucleolar protein 14